MSEQILLLNRKHRKSRRRRARRRRASRSRRRRMPAALRAYHASRGTTRRRRRYNRRRRHHYNRRRRHYNRRRRHYNPRRRHYNVRRRRRNPLSFKRRAMGAAVGVGPIVIGAAGGVLLDVAWGYLAPKIVPANYQTGWPGLAAKLAVLYGSAWALNKFLLKSPRARLMSRRAVYGASTVLAYGALKGALQSMTAGSSMSIPGLSGYMDYHSYALPGMRMGGYMPRTATLGSLEDLYSPAAVIQPPGTPVPRQFGGYIAAQPGLGAYQPHVATDHSLSGYDWRNDGM